MTFSISAVPTPIFVQILTALDKILDKLAAHCETKKIDPAVFLNARLYPDMFDCKRQVQLTTDFAKGCMARLAGQEVPSYADTETTIPELKARIAKTLDFIKTIPESALDGAETREIVMQTRLGTMTFDGKTYLLNAALPNFFFHATTAYDILRTQGVEIGKGDFLNRG